MYEKKSWRSTLRFYLSLTYLYFMFRCCYKIYYSIYDHLKRNNESISIRFMLFQLVRMQILEKKLFVLIHSNECVLLKPQKKSM